MRKENEKIIGLKGKILKLAYLFGEGYDVGELISSRDK